jgi:hypothetical protein
MPFSATDFVNVEKKIAIALQRLWRQRCHRRSDGVPSQSAGADGQNGSRPEDVAVCAAFRNAKIRPRDVVA